MGESFRFCGGDSDPAILPDLLVGRWRVGQIEAKVTGLGAVVEAALEKARRNNQSASGTNALVKATEVLES